MAKSVLWSRFGKLGRESGGVAIQTASKFVTVDSGQHTSPLPYNSSVLALSVPDDAVQLVVAPTTDMRISEDQSMTHYDVIVAGAKEALPVALMPTVYLRRDSVDGTVRFRFVKV